MVTETVILNASVNVLMYSYVTTHWPRGSPVPFPVSIPVAGENVLLLTRPGTYAIPIRAEPHGRGWEEGFAGEAVDSQC